MLFSDFGGIHVNKVVWCRIGPYSRAGLCFPFPQSSNLYSALPHPLRRVYLQYFSPGYCHSCIMTCHSFRNPRPPLTIPGCVWPCFSPGPDPDPHWQAPEGATSPATPCHHQLTIAACDVRLSMPPNAGPNLANPQDSTPKACSTPHGNPGMPQRMLVPRRKIQVELGPLQLITRKRAACVLVLISFGFGWL